jgi:ADP-ribose pyrophosphatase
VKPLRTEIVYRTPYCELMAKTMKPGEDPWYSLRGADYTAVVALTGDRRLLVVRQYRPAVERFTIELPSGIVDPGESPEQSARRELLEETGHQAGQWEALGSMLPDPGRLGTRAWLFLAAGVRPVEGWSPEESLEVSSYSMDELARAIENGVFEHALHVAALVPAMLRGKLRLG